MRGGTADCAECWLQPDMPDIAGIAEGTLPRFDYMNETERQMALLYRQHEACGCGCCCTCADGGDRRRS